eukprot:scaffold459_cov117-Isochrysis_galbana.AAC.7
MSTSTSMSGEIATKKAQSHLGRDDRIASGGDVLGPSKGFMKMRYADPIVLSLPGDPTSKSATWSPFTLPSTVTERPKLPPSRGSGASCLAHEDTLRPSAPKNST